MHLSGVMPLLARSIWVVALVASLASVARSESYIFTTLQDPLANGITQGGGINNARQVTGDYYDGSGIHGFLYNAGAYSTVDDPLAVGLTEAVGINNAGQIVGFYNDGSGAGHGFFDDNGTFTTIDDPNATGTPPLCVHGSGTTSLPCPMTEPLGINNSGQLAGNYYNGTVYNGFFDSGGIGCLTAACFTSISDPLGAEGTYVEGVNDAGEMVGVYIDGAGGHHGFLYSGGTFMTIDDPLGTGVTGASPYTVLDGINNLDQIVGFYVNGGGIGGFSYSGGVYTAIDDPSAIMTNADEGIAPVGINDAGQISGEFTPAAGQENGFIATPTPEPTTLALLFVGFLGMVGYRIRERLPGDRRSE
jgi:probable HAF family extracellular repeat protein